MGDNTEQDLSVDHAKAKWQQYVDKTIVTKSVMNFDLMTNFGAVAFISAFEMFLYCMSQSSELPNTPAFVSVVGEGGIDLASASLKENSIAFVPFEGKRAQEHGPRNSAIAIIATTKGKAFAYLFPTSALKPFDDTPEARAHLVAIVDEVSTDLPVLGFQATAEKHGLRSSMGVTIGVVQPDGYQMMATFHMNEENSSFEEIVNTQKPSDKPVPEALRVLCETAGVGVGDEGPFMTMFAGIFEEAKNYDSPLANLGVAGTLRV